MCWGRNKVSQILSVVSVLPQGAGTQQLSERLCFNHGPAFPSSVQPQPLQSILHSCLGSLEIAAVNTDQDSQDLPGQSALPKPLLGTASPSPASAGSHLHVWHGELGAEAGDAMDGIARLLVLWEAVPPIHGGVS